MGSEEHRRKLGEWLASIPTVGHVDRCGDYPYLPLTTNRGFLAKARASAAAMRGRKRVLSNYGDDPSAWPVLTPEELAYDLNNNRCKHLITATLLPSSPSLKRDISSALDGDLHLLHPAEAFLGIRISNLPRPGPYFDQREEFSKYGGHPPANFLAHKTGVIPRVLEVGHNVIL